MENSRFLELNKKEPDKNKERNEGNSNSSNQNNIDDVNSSFNSILMDTSKNEPACSSNNSVILEQLPSDNDSIENDCSYEEIELASVTNQNFKEQNLAICVAKTPKMQLNFHSDIGGDGQNTEDNNEEFIKCIIYGIIESSNFDDETTFPSKSSNSFNLFEEINLSDSLIENHLKPTLLNESSNQNTKLNSDIAIRELLLKVKQLEETVIVKEAALNALTLELESLKEIHSNNSSTLNSGTSTTEYRCIHDELQNKIVDFQNALAYRDNIIQQLTESLQQSVNRKEELQRESQLFLQEINLLKQQLLDTSSLFCENKNKSNLVESEIQTEAHFEITDTVALWTNNDLLNLLVRLESQLNPSQMNLFSDIKMKLYENMKETLSNCKRNNEENVMLQDELSNKNEQELKIAQFNELVMDAETSEFSRLRLELEVKHAKEMEELRTYFEQKCADLEKHYSEEVLNSRKLSGSSYCSGHDLNSDVFLSNNEMGPGGDTSNLTNNIEKYNVADITKSDIQKFKNDLQKICDIMETFDLINATNSELHLLVQSISVYDMKLLTQINLTEIQNRNHTELEILRDNYENRISLLDVEYNKKIQDIERKHNEEISSLKEQLQNNVRNQHEVANPGESELAEVVQSYERKLQEQVMLAKIDIINALEYQIQL
ncbi:centrosomal protein of 112 kDa-like [Agrilus planipennis]|uniref:Centrosomal protein of 112 kDa-like n=1 Tax=Agrilus planipennis TaxID=224129 RepID=A0A7F5RIV1_AGRPL|nr:centrosomal protein of 112 kDa-like [Agrilus planipennis]